MAISGFLAPVIPADIDIQEFHKRTFRWRFFQIGFVFMYTGVLMDVITTALGVARTGSGYEQNPLGGLLIGNAGWLGLAALMTGLCLVCYVSFKTVYWRMSLRWSAFLNTVLVLVVAFRWLAVVTAILYLLQPR